MPKHNSDIATSLLGEISSRELLFVCINLGVSIAALYEADAYKLTGISHAVPVYFACTLLFFSRGSNLLFTIGLVSSSTIFPFVDNSVMVRLAIFCLLFSAMDNNLRVSPFYIALTTWLLSFSLSSLVFSTENSSNYAFNSYNLVQMLLEVFALIICGIFIASRPNTDGPNAKKHRFLSQVAYIQHIVALIFWGIGIIQVFIGCDLLNIPLSTMPEVLVSNRTITIPVLAFYFIIPICISITLGDKFSQIAELIENHLSALAPRFSSNIAIPRITEFSDLAYMVQDRLFTYRHENHSMTMQNVEMQKRLVDLNRQNALLKSKDSFASELMNNSPWYTIRISKEGIIQIFSQELSRRLANNEDALLDMHYTELKNLRDYGSTLTEIISEADKTFADNDRINEFKKLTPLSGDKFLESLIKRAKTEEASKKLDVNQSTGQPTLSTRLLVYLRELPRPTAFQAKTLKPTEIELIGTRAVDVCKVTEEASLKLIAQTSSGKKSLLTLQNTQQTAKERNEALLDSIACMTKLEKGVHEVAENLHKMTRQLEKGSQTSDKYDFSTAIKEAISFLNNILLVDTERSLKFSQETEDGCYIYAVQADITNLLRHFMALITELIKQDFDIALELTTESISSKTAELIHGSYPGDYVRLSATHQGVSIANHMLRDSVPETAKLQSMEVSLYLLIQQTKNLGGFLLVDNIGSKNTRITIYLPKDNSREYASALKDSEEPNIDTDINGYNALLIGAGPDIITPVYETLQALNYETLVQHPSNALKLLNQSLELPGIGLDLNRSGTHALIEAGEPNPMEPSSFANFSLIIAINQMLTDNMLAILTYLNTGQVNAKKIALVNPLEKISTPLAYWTILDLPFEKEVLCQELQRLSHNNPGQPVVSY